jgi:copper oxidase (laccase) domain-containing protein
MQAAYGCDPTQMLAALGPSIGPESYEVGEEVYALAQAKLVDAGRYFHFPDGEGTRPHFDLWRANAAQLCEAGIPPDQIEISGIDTAQHTDDFFSHRAEQGRCGLFAMMAWLAPRN